jgi:hypothetical protein
MELEVHWAGQNPHRIAMDFWHQLKQCRQRAGATSFTLTDERLLFFSAYA